MPEAFVKTFVMGMGIFCLGMNVVYFLLFNPDFSSSEENTGEANNLMLFAVLLDYYIFPWLTLILGIIFKIGQPITHSLGVLVLISFYVTMKKAPQKNGLGVILIFLKSLYPLSVYFF